MPITAAVSVCLAAAAKPGVNVTCPAPLSSRDGQCERKKRQRETEREV